MHGLQKKLHRYSDSRRPIVFVIKHCNYSFGKAVCTARTRLDRRFGHNNSASSLSVFAAMPFSRSTLSTGFPSFDKTTKEIEQNTDTSIFLSQDGVQHIMGPLFKCFIAVNLHKFLHLRSSNYTHSLSTCEQFESFGTTVRTFAYPNKKAMCAGLTVECRKPTHLMICWYRLKHWAKVSCIGQSVARVLDGPKFRHYPKLQFKGGVII